MAALEDQREEEKRAAPPPLLLPNRRRRFPFQIVIPSLSFSEAKTKKIQRAKMCSRNADDCYFPQYLIVEISSSFKFTCVRILGIRLRWCEVRHVNSLGRYSLFDLLMWLTLEGSLVQMSSLNYQASSYAQRYLFGVKRPRQITHCLANRKVRSVFISIFSNITHFKHLLGINW